MGYVGLPLATAFGRHLPTIGFDIDSHRVKELQSGYDRNGETPPDELQTSSLSFTDDPTALKRADFIIAAVGTPLDKLKRPDLSSLLGATKLIGQSLTNHPLSSEASHHPPVIVYESSVYPGCTEEVCIPALERESGLKAGRDFKVGYSPERINPADSVHSLQNVIKVVSAQDSETLKLLAQVYGLVIKAGTYMAPNIRTAEATKLTENIQRDINIALMNELAMLFHRLGLNTQEVLKAAKTKWNFVPLEPGMVGGHCIPIVPYYMNHKAQEVGYYSELMLAARRVNEAMEAYIARETIKLLAQAGKTVRGARILMLGFTYKENVRDVRDTRVLELVKELESYGAEVWVHDPMVKHEQLKRLGLKPVADPFAGYRGRRREGYDAVILAVLHQQFRDKEKEAYLALLKDEGAPGVLVDLKGALPLTEREKLGILYWSL